MKNTKFFFIDMKITDFENVKNNFLIAVLLLIKVNIFFYYFLFGW